MVNTAESLMRCGFQVQYAYTESDEISLLLASQEQLFGRKLRKYNSTLAGEASAAFSLLLGKPASFDCRISQLPRAELVVDYFRWRNEDAARNALNAWCYWTLRKNGHNERQATERLLGLTVAQSNELLFQYGINFNDLPAWQKRGIGLYWEAYEKQGRNKLTEKPVTAVRRRVKREFELPMKEAYSAFVLGRLGQQPLAN